MLSQSPAACSSACLGSLLCNPSPCQGRVAGEALVSHDRGTDFSALKLRPSLWQKVARNNREARRVFFPQSQAEPGRKQQNRGETIMYVRQILATATLCTLLTGAGLAQVTGGTIQERKSNQQERIGQGVRSGQLTAGETRNLERREGSVNREEHAMRRADGGHLTAQDKAALTRRQNNISRSINKDKHNARVR